MKNVLFQAAILGLLWSATASAQTDTRPGPKWRLEALTYGVGSSAGLYHHQGENLDLGLNVSGHLSKSDDDTEAQVTRTQTGIPSYVMTDSGTSESSELSVYAGPELRRWAVRTDHLSIYFGATVDAAYSRHERDSFDPDAAQQFTRERRRDELERSVALGLGATFGASLHLTDHLAVLMSMSPASFSCRWRQLDTHREYRTFPTVSPSQFTTEEQYSTRKSTEPSFRFSVSPGLFATLDF